MSDINKASSNNIRKLYLHPAFLLNIKQAVTNIYALKSPVAETVLTALCNLDFYLNRNEFENIPILLEHHLFDELFNTLDRHSRNENIARVIMKIIVRVSNHEEYMPFFDDFNEKLSIILDYFVSANNTFVFERCSLLLFRFSKRPLFRHKIVSPAVLDKIFNTIALYPDKNVRMFCILTIYELSFYKELELNLCVMPEFKLHILTALINDTHFSSIVLDILYQFSQWASHEIHKKIFHTPAVEHLIDALMVEMWTNDQNQIISIFHKSANSKVDCTCFEKVARELMKFTQFARETSATHGLAAASLLSNYAQIKKQRIVLFDLNCHEEIAGFLKYDCDFMKIKICDVIGHICSDCIINDWEHQFYIKEFAKILEKRTIPWSPYRQAPIFPLYIFLMSNTNLTSFYYEQNILGSLQAALTNRSNLDKAYISYLVEMYEVLLATETYHSLLLNSDLYDFFFRRFKNCIDKNFDTLYKSYLNIISFTLKSDLYRELFLSNNGPQWITYNLNMHLEKTNCRLLHFINVAITYEQIACAFLRCNTQEIIEKIISRLGPTPRKEVCQSIAIVLSKYDVTFKFYNYKYLDFNDKIKKWFIMYLGRNPKDFPLIEHSDKCKETNFIVVNLTQEPKQFSNSTEMIPSFTQKKNIFSKPSTTTQVTTFSHQSKFSVKPAIVKVRYPLKSIMKKSFLRPIYTPEDRSLMYHGFKSVMTDAESNSSMTSSPCDISIDSCSMQISVCSHKISSITNLCEYDKYLQKYLSDIKHLFTKIIIKGTVQKKIEIIGKYVCNIFERTPCNQNLHKNHLDVIKRSIKSQYIPLGMIRIGSFAERALLFKILADQVGIPCTLRRSIRLPDFMWNEIPIYCRKGIKHSKIKEFNAEHFSSVSKCYNRKYDDKVIIFEKDGYEESLGMHHCVVDLDKQPGSIYPMSSLDAYFYIEQVPKSKQDDPTVMYDYLDEYIAP